MNDITSSSPNRQMPLIEIQFANIRRVEHNGIEFFSLVDLMAVFSDLESRPDVLWRRTSARLTQDGFQHDQKVIKLKLQARDGKMRLTECADGQTVMRIVQSIPSPNAEFVRDWLAGMGYQAYEEARKPEKAVIRRETELEMYDAAGYGQHPAVQLFRKRHQNKETFKCLMTAVDRVCEKPNYSHFVNSEYLALFGEIAANLKIILGSESIRDALPPYQLAILTAAEAGLQLIFEHRDRLTMDEILNIIERHVRPIGKNLKELCDSLGIHHITGQRLIKGG